MKKILIFGIAALAAMAMTVTPVLAGPSCSSHGNKTTDAKLTSANGTCSGGDIEACAKKLGLSVEETKALCDELGDKCDFTYMSIEGMTCGGCESGVKTALLTAPGVRKVVRVSHKDGLAIVAVDRENFCEKTATKMIIDQGYTAEIIPAVARSGDIAPTKLTNASTSDAKSSCAKACSSKEKAACAAKDKAADKKTDDIGGTL